MRLLLVTLMVVAALAVAPVGAARVHVHEDANNANANNNNNANANNNNNNNNSNNNGAAAAAAASSTTSAPLLAACPHFFADEPLNVSAGETFGCESFLPPAGNNPARVFLEWTIGAERPSVALLARFTAFNFDVESSGVSMLTTGDWFHINATRVRAQVAEHGSAVVLLGYTPVFFWFEANAVDASSAFVMHTFFAEAPANAGVRALELDAEDANDTGDSPRANYTLLSLPNSLAPIDTVVTIDAPRADSGAAVLVGVDRVADADDYDFLVPFVDGVARINATELLLTKPRFRAHNLWGSVLVLGVAAPLFDDARTPTIAVSQLPRAGIVAPTPPSKSGGQLLLPALGENCTWWGHGWEYPADVGQAFFAVCASATPSCARVRISAARDLHSFLYPTVVFSANRFPSSYWEKNIADLSPSQPGVVDAVAEFPFEPSFDYGDETQCQAWWWVAQTASNVSIVVECVAD